MPIPAAGALGAYTGGALGAYGGSALSIPLAKGVIGNAVAMSSPVLSRAAGVAFDNLVGKGVDEIYSRITRPNLDSNDYWSQPQNRFPNRPLTENSNQPPNQPPRNNENNMLFNNQNPNFSTQQTTDARNNNQSFAAGASADQLLLEAQRRRQEAEQIEAQVRGQMNFGADLGNRTANANTARSMALDTTQNLNRMYATAGDRLNQAAANTQNSLINAASSIASMFR
jgi:hypothetical protein